MKSLRSSFSKYHGNGNDFIIFDGIEELDDLVSKKLVAHAPLLCDRHRGIGGDGVIILAKDNALINATIINSDGSFAENCGNGLRCAASYLFKTYQLTNPIEITLAHRRYECLRIGDDIIVHMGACKIVPIDHSAAHGYIGNEHMVFLLEHLKQVDAALQDIKAVVPNWSQLNIGFVSRDATGRIHSRVFERGIGFTNSCGSGACVAASFFHVTNESPHGSYVVSQPGGDIGVDVTLKHRTAHDVTYEIIQRGKAVEIFTGIFQFLENC